jgi:hypothetical protein
MGKPELHFNEHYKKLLLDYDFEFFLKNNIEENQYPKENIQEIYEAYHNTLPTLKQELKQNKKKQYLKYLEGQVRLMFNGGFLPALFKIDGWTKEHSFLRFPEIGENWAYFDLWQKLERRKQQKQQIWDKIVKTGALLAYILTLVKLFEVLLSP